MRRGAPATKQKADACSQNADGRVLPQQTPQPTSLPTALHETEGLRPAKFLLAEHGSEFALKLCYNFKESLMTFAKISRLLLALTASLGGTLAFAGGSAVVTYVPAGANVPTLSEWTLLALAALMALLSYRHFRARLQGRPLAALFLAAGAGTLALAGGHFGQEALATANTDTSLLQQGGGTVTLNCGNTGNVINNTGITVKITSVTGSPTPTGTCTNLPTLAPTASCTVSNFCPG